MSATSSTTQIDSEGSMRRSTHLSGTTCKRRRHKLWRSRFNNSVKQAAIPVQVLNVAGTGPISSITAITGGGDDTCALTSAGAVLCWGNDNSGEIGNPNTANLFAIPQQVPGLTSGVIEIGSGYQHNCAITNAGGVMCWGLNLNGQLGNGTNRASVMPVASGPVVRVSD